MIRRYELSEEEWKRVENLLPPENTGKRGRPAKDNRTMLNGMVWLARSGASWRDLPERYGPWKSVYSRFCKWRDEGLFQRVFEELSFDEADMEELSLDSTTIRAHPSAAGGKKGAAPISDEAAED